MSAGAPHRLLAHMPRLYARYEYTRMYHSSACAAVETWEACCASDMLKLCILGEPLSSP